ncbi:MAG TPA: hypothetical protein VGN61_04165 [Verrucomicrobiae bacterium]
MPKTLTPEKEAVRAIEFARERWNQFASANNALTPSSLHYDNFDDLPFAQQLALEDAAAKHLAGEFTTVKSN